MIKAAIFDLDGVLVDTIPYAVQAGNATLKEYGITRTTEEIKKAMGRKAIVNYTEYVRSRGLDIEPAALIKKRDILFFKMIKGNLKPLPGVRAFLAGLERGGFRMAVASSSSRAWVSTCLAEAGLLKWFSIIVTGDDVKTGKPDPEPFLLAAKMLGVMPEECTVFEDAENGVEAAGAAGMKCVGITNTPGQDISDADLVVGSLEEINVEKLRSL
jgi:HAD superfamily hydrolase (TIGR01509 family)